MFDLKQCWIWPLHWFMFDDSIPLVIQNQLFQSLQLTRSARHNQIYIQPLNANPSCSLQPPFQASNATKDLIFFSLLLIFFFFGLFLNKLLLSLWLFIIVLNVKLCAALPLQTLRTGTHLSGSSHTATQGTFPLPRVTSNIPGSWSAHTINISMTDTRLHTQTHTNTHRYHLAFLCSLTPNPLVSSEWNLHGISNGMEL